jgi:hypothetical protein
VDEILFQVLADGVARYLDSVDRLAASQQAFVATELRRMSAAWRALLGLHRPTGARARCRGCGHRPTAASGRTAGPGHHMCNVWRVASAYFVLRLPNERSRFVRE